MEKDKYKYVWLDAKINEGKNPQQLQIFKFIGLPELIGYAAIS